MICSASQIDSFWKTFVLSNDWESSMRAIVIEPPRFGVAAAARCELWPASAAGAPAAPTSRSSRNKTRGLRAFTVTPSNGEARLTFCIQHTAHLTHDRTSHPLARPGPAAPGGAQAAFAHGRGLAGGTDHQRRRDARKSPHRDRRG